MKYGEHFEKESAPQWSLHNIDYNSLKHHIKVHTTRDQATAIAIPGQPDTGLSRFEDELFTELCRQHDRVDMFVSSKADEIARRLQHLSTQIHRLLIRCAASRRERMSLKRRQRFARHENDLLQCGNDIQSLQRFVGAQVVAFRKILKKYRKWTGSATLGSRFRDTVLSHPKSFTRRDFSQLQSEQQELLETLRSAVPTSLDGAASPYTESSAASIRPSEQVVSPSETIVAHEQQNAGYWNEYDNGSEAGDAGQNGGEAYTININPDEDTSFLGLTAIAAFFATPVRKMNEWITVGHRAEEDGDERGPLLPTHAAPYGTTDAGYFDNPPGSSGGSGGPGGTSDTEADEDDARAADISRRGSYGYASSEEFPVGYKAYYAALPSIREQHLARYRERVLFWGTWACFAASFVLMGIAGLLIMTGRHKMRLEVDAGVTLGIMASLGAACAALGLSFSRQDHVRLATQLAVWTSFTVACVLNGMLLVLVVGNPPL